MQKVTESQKAIKRLEDDLIQSLVDFAEQLPVGSDIEGSVREYLNNNKIDELMEIVDLYEKEEDEKDSLREDMISELKFEICYEVESRLE
ncbi:hypothetical protein [Gottfriedia solisilvae]|uniref:hypothetical protein n=1 Tax=Gottfriedia solisilvae TaxID=1516104 RepID=UPI003D2F30DA